MWLWLCIGDRGHQVHQLRSVAQHIVHQSEPIEEPEPINEP